MRRLLSAILALYLAAGVLPVQILAEETEEPIEEQSEVIEEAEEITETEEETEEEIIIPEETAVPEETEIPEITEEPVQTEEPVIEEAVPETAEPVIEEVIPEQEEITVPEETAVPEVTEEPVIEEVIPEPVEEVIPETAEPEEVIEEPVEEHTEAPAAEEVIPETEEPVIEEKSGEEAEVFESKYKITFDANGGVFPDGSSKMTDTTYDDGDIYVDSSEKPYKDGYAFYGWYTTKDMKDSTRAGGMMTFTKDTTLYAGYKPCYTVTLNVNYIGYLFGYTQEGKYIDEKTTASYKIIKGMTAVTEDTFMVHEPEGYLFTGWYLDKYCTPGKEAENYIPAGNITLYAGWAESNTIEVVYHGNGGKYGGKETVTDDIRMSSAIEDVPEFKKSGEVIEGWYIDKGLTQKIPDIYAFYPGYANKTGDPVHLYAKWISPVKVTLDANGGKLLGSKKKTYNVAKGEGIKDFGAEPERSGYIFDGWYTSTDYVKKIDVSEYPFTSSMTVYAKWTPAVKVTFKGNNKGAFYDYDEEEDGNNLKNAVYLVAKGDTFAESCSKYGNLEYLYGILTNVTDMIPAFYANSGYTFAGWFKDSALTKPFSFEKDKLTADTTLYPKTVKTSSAKKYTVTINANGGLFEDDVPDHFTYYKDEYFTYSAWWITAPAGKKLAGFTTVKNDASTLISPLQEVMESLPIQTEYKITSNITLYAYYVPEYTVILESNGGYFRDGYYWSTAYVVKRTVGKGEKITDIYPKSEDSEGTILTTEDGKIFLGWYSDKACKTLVTHKLHQYAIKKNQTLYAKWGKPLKAGWKKTSGKWWYQCEDGSYYNEGLQKIGKKYYFFQSNGYILTGWKQVGSAWYYFNTGGDAAVGWKKIGKVWYYFSAEGVMQKSWKKISGKWYYFKPSGAMVTGWQKIGGKWYWFESGGAMVTGWKKISGKWYWFDSSGVMKTGWKKLSGKWYYFDSSGAMVTGTRTIGGKTYNFDSNGVCLNP